MQPSYMIRYQFDTSGGDISTDEENILIGFSTQEKRGILMFIRNDATPQEYISIEINNNGLSSVISFLGRLLQVDLIKPVSNVRPSVRSQKGFLNSMKFGM